MEMQEYACEQVFTAKGAPIEWVCCPNRQDQFFTDLTKVSQAAGCHRLLEAGCRRFLEVDLEREDFTKDCFFRQYDQKLVVEGSFIKGFVHASGIQTKWNQFFEDEISRKNMRAETLSEDFLKKHNDFLKDVDAIFNEQKPRSLLW